MDSHRPAVAPESVTVIMPTLAQARRARVLEAAVSSVLSQPGVLAVPLVVVNGSYADPSLITRLERTPGVRLIHRQQAHQGDALAAGRAAVDTPWFTELDDDDVLLPGALALRLQHVSTLQGAAVLVSNGWVQRGESRRLAIPDVDRVAANPLAAMADGTWLLPGAGLFRTEAVDTELLTNLPRYLEWTCLALRLAHRGDIHFLDQPTFVHHEGRADGLWGSPECVLGLPAGLRRVIDRDVVESLRPEFIRRLASACNTAANLELARGRWRQAWRWHLQCLGSGGWEYLPYTRKLLPGLRSRDRVP